MTITVGKDVIKAKRNLKEVFPREFANRFLINEFITYVLNNFFEKSNEKLVNGYVGEVVPSIDGTECYIKEPTTERQMNQIIPVLKAGDEKITFNNFIADLHNDGCQIYDQNKLLASKNWSWSPAFNVDMFLNYTTYYWVGWDRREESIKLFDIANMTAEELEGINDSTFKYYILTRSIDVEKEIIGQKSFTYVEYDEDGYEIEESEYKFKNDDIVVFTNDTGNAYNSIPYVISGCTDDDNGYVTLTPMTMPLIVLSKMTDIAGGALGKKTFNYKDEDHGIDFMFQNGMRIYLLNDINSEYNNKIFMVDGVGTSIKMIDDSFDPYKDTYSADTDYKKICAKQDYFLMDRGCIDGNSWSVMNRWVHRNALEVFNVSSLTTTSSDGGLQHAARPILCFLKNIELYNHGTFGRGNVVVTTEKSITKLTNLDFQVFCRELGLETTEISVGDNILLTTSTSGKHIYKLKLTSNNKTALQVVTNGQSIGGITSDGTTYAGDSVYVLKGDNAGETLYYDGSNWVEGQSKLKINQKPLYNLYDSDKVLLNNEVNYPESTFEGCTLFEYATDTSSTATTDDYLDMAVVINDSDKNYGFNNTIETDSYYYTPLNEYQKEFTGYRFFRTLDKDEYLNDWHLSSSEFNQYIKTSFEASDKNAFVTKTINEVDKEYYSFELKYNISTTSSKRPLLIYKNGSLVGTDNYIVEGKIIYVLNTNLNDTFVVYLLTNDDVTRLDDSYAYDIPVSLIVNQFNEEIETISYNNCFDQMLDIIENQVGLTGEASGANNYSSLDADLSVGTKIVQNSSTIIRSMILNNNSNTSVRATIDYVKNAYVKFKQKYTNMVEQYIINGTISSDNETYMEYKSSTYLMDDTIAEIIEKINIGKEGLKPFYNNGILHLVDNAYIPSTPAYLGVANCFEPRIITWDDFTTSNKPTVIMGHDGSLTKASNTVKDLFILRLEELIYDSINSKFKEDKCGINKYNFLPGYFRTKTYTREEYLNTYSVFFNLWCNENNVDYGEHINFDYDITTNTEAWKTWNYTDCTSPDGVELHGSYRAIYNYYYDTYRPDTHPWEMFGFGEQPSWWEESYGPAPYTSSNIILWNDIENGIIRGGESAGEYDCFKRPNFVKKFLPVDNQGNLKSPYDIGYEENGEFIHTILDHYPMIQLARNNWEIGDIGDIEFAYLQTSYSKYVDEEVNYLLRPVEWVETNWNTVDREVLFKGTDYEQVIDASTDTREDLSKMIMHNELVDGSYVQKTGIQQWFADYLTYNNLDITTNLADKIRTSEVVLGYRCAGFYQKDTVEITTDSYDELPEENVHMNLFKSKLDGTITYSGILVERTKKGYKVNGFDKSYPYFYIRKPQTQGKKTNVEIDGITVIHYNTYTSEVEKVPYNTEFYSVQEVYTMVNSYGKYLEDNEKWYFSTRSPDGTVSNFRTASESFLHWSSVQKGEDSIGNIILLNPGVLGLGNYTNGVVEDLNNKINGLSTVVNTHGKPLDAKSINVLRKSFNTFFKPIDANIAMIKCRKYHLEHLITLDNTTLFGDTLYDSKYYTILGRFNLSGVKVKNWYGDIYAPGYLLTDDGAIPNFDKKANDLQYIFDVDDVHCQGDIGRYSKGVVGYEKTKTYKQLYKNDISMFDFYKGAIKEKGTMGVINRMNRTTNVSSTGNNIEIYEQWAFKAGEFGHISDNSVLEFLLEPKKLKQNSQIITFETATDYYYDMNTVYNRGDLVVYNNYEYVCQFSGTTGIFDYDKWKQIRFVGNYIIFWDDENWLKKQKNNLLNCFKYTNNIIVNPIGGFAQTSDCEYIVADEEAAEEVKDSMVVGETIWIVKTENDSWDILKKTGVNKFISMRYDTLEDVFNQKEFDTVYHFTDDKKEYYTMSNSDNIDLTDNLYTDIDCENYICKWSDIGKPEYTGNVGTYVKGKDYKVKLYNTVFYTTIPESNLNNSTPFTDLDRNVSLTYSNMLLNMTQFGTTSYKFKWKFTLKVDTRAPDVSIILNGVEYKNPTDNKVDIIVCEGDTIEWETSAYCCGTRKGSVYVKPVEYSEYKGNPNTVIKRPLYITVPMSYRDGKIMKEVSYGVTNEEILMYYDGNYELSMVGGGGGAGGGTYQAQKKKKWYKRAFHAITSVVSLGSAFGLGLSLSSVVLASISKSQWSMYNKRYSWQLFPSGGCGAASGAYLHGSLRIDDITNKTISEWLTNTPYTVGTYVSYTDGKIYKCVKAHTSKDTLIVYSDGVAYWKEINQITSSTNKYTFTNGIAGKGGKVGAAQGLTHGSSGEDSAIYKNGTTLVYAQSGAGGPASKNGSNLIQNNRLLGYGGKLQTSLEYTIHDFTLSNDSKNGNDGNPIGYQGTIGQSVYPSGNYGKGGDWVYSGNGKAGIGGYTRIKYCKGENYDEYDYDPSTQGTDVPHCSREIMVSDSYEYSSYYQPYIIKPDATTRELIYFYAYDVMKDDTNRPNAEKVNSGTKFYKNRARAVAAYHKGDVVKNIWAEKVMYSVGDRVTHWNGTKYVYYNCLYDHTSTDTFSETITVEGTTITVWEEYAPTYYYKITWNKAPYAMWESETQYAKNDNIRYINNGVITWYTCKTAHKSGTTFDSSKWTEVENPMEATYNSGAYELYDDENCTIRTTKNNIGTDGDYFMNCADLDFTRGYTTGSTYYLVDGFADYDQLTPRYLDEPSWGTINQNGYYDITSGRISYYAASDQEDVENTFTEYEQWAALTTYELDDNVVYNTKAYRCITEHTSTSTFDSSKWEEVLKAYVYEDDNCSTVVKSINGNIQIIDTKEVLIYSDENMLYSFLTDTVQDHLEPSYEIKDNDTYMYSSIPSSDITNDDIVYQEYGLENELGLYGDYVPTWEQKVYYPNEYKNTVKYITYTSDDLEDEHSVKTYTTTLLDKNDKETDFYYVVPDVLPITYAHLYMPSTMKSDGTIEYDNSSGTQLGYVKLYTLNEYTVEEYDDMETITSPTAGQVCKVKHDKNYSNQVTYYQYVSSKWSFVAAGTNILTHNELFSTRRYTDTIKVYTTTDTSTLYADDTYLHPTLKQGSVLDTSDTTSNTSINLYYNKQGVGNHLTSDTLIEQTDNLGQVKIMFTNVNNDEMLTALEAVLKAKTEKPEKSVIEICEEYCASYNSSFKYIDVDELIDTWYEYERDPVNHYKNGDHFRMHTCKVCNMYRNGDEKTYYKLYLYGQTFYYGYNTVDDLTGISTLVGVKMGNVEDLTTYTKTVKEYDETKSYVIGDICLYNQITYQCIAPTTGEFDEECWEVLTISEDAIVNIISYKEIGDYFYISHDSYTNRNSVHANALTDEDSIANIDGSYSKVGQKGWMKVEFIDKDFMFNLISLERKRIATDNIKSCYLVNNDTDATMVKVQVFDPIQNIIPNDVLDEVNYISSIDPVNDYDDGGHWNDNKIGYLWWDTSKVRYVDYYQGDYEYRRQNWGKQLPGSEIVINEWTRSTEAPTDGRKYVTRSIYNYNTANTDTYYYYWIKNPVDIPEVVFRKTSALTISSIINDPTGEGIVWMSPIDSNINGKQENTMIICNFNNVMNGQDTVLQINMDSDKDVLDHTEWAMVKENTEMDIPEFLWQKLKDSLLGTKVIDGETVSVPDYSLQKRQRLGISYRPRQSMFEKIYNARENFIDVVNDIFANRSFSDINFDITSSLIDNVDLPSTEDYADTANTKLEMMSWKDAGLIGKNVLVLSDESLDNIWSIYTVNEGWTYTLVKYQKYNIQKYLTYTDWYIDNEIKYLTPIYTISSSQTDAQVLASTLKEDQMVKYSKDGAWDLYQNRMVDGELSSMLVGRGKTLLHVNSYIYDYVNDSTLDDSEPFITIGEESLTKYQYIYNETQYLLEKIIEYFED